MDHSSKPVTVTQWTDTVNCASSLQAPRVCARERDR